jgi:hypothetical protein
MLPLIPKSVKMEAELSAQLKEAANLLGYSENQLIVESVKVVIHGAADKTNAFPKVMALIRSAKDHQEAPQKFGTTTASPSPSGRNGVKKWWGA